MAHVPADSPHTIVLAVDGLRASALGAYGNCAYETPAIDSLAVESRVWDRCYADTHDPAVLYGQLGDYLPERGALLVSDCTSVFELEFAERFESTKQIRLATPSACAASIGETVAAANWAGFAEAVAAWREGQADTRLFAWLHTRGMYGPWDAPHELAESLSDEDDPDWEPSVEPPDARYDDPSSADACEARFAAACRYAAQIITLDACIEGFLDVIHGLFEGESLRIILLGLRGFPLGEHGRVGGADTRLFSEQQQTPLVAQAIEPDNRFTRLGWPTTLSQAIGRELRESAEKPTSDAELFSTSGDRCLHSEAWMLRVPGKNADDAELYVKPDDRWEQNDVASLMPAMAEELQSLLSAKAGSAGPSDVASPGASN